MGHSFYCIFLFFRTVFPDATTINTSRNVGENLTEWEGSPSSDDHDTDVASICATLPNQIKYIPINYFAYFDNANLESDEFTDQAVNHLPQPPPLPQVRFYFKKIPIFNGG